MDISTRTPYVVHDGTDQDSIRTERPSSAWAADMLSRQGMPSAEIGSTLRATDPEIIRRHLELHRERLKEQLDAHFREIEQLERLLGVDRAVGQLRAGDAMRPSGLARQGAGGGMPRSARLAS